MYRNSTTWKVQHPSLYANYTCTITYEEGKLCTQPKESSGNKIQKYSCRSSHYKELNADAMNVNPGGKQPAMRQTVYNRNVQEMTLPNGTAKGMKMVLEERGVCTNEMVAKDMTATLKANEDFKNSIERIN